MKELAVHENREPAKEDYLLWNLGRRGRSQAAETVKVSRSAVPLIEMHVAFPITAGGLGPWALRGKMLFLQPAARVWGRGCAVGLLR